MFKKLLLAAVFIFSINVSNASEDLRFFDFVNSSEGLSIYSPNTVTTSMFVQRLKSFFRDRQVAIQVVNHSGAILIYIDNYVDLHIIKIESDFNSSSDFTLIGEAADISDRQVLLPANSLAGVEALDLKDLSYSKSQAQYFLYRNIGRTSCDEYRTCIENLSVSPKNIVLSTFEGGEGSKLRILRNFRKIVVVPEESITERVDLLKFDFILSRENPNNQYFLPVYIEQQCEDLESEKSQFSVDWSFHFLSMSTEGEYFLGKLFPGKNSLGTPYSVNFARNSATVNSLDRFKINLLRKKINTKSTFLHFTGEADSIGSTITYNRDLALRRIEAVKEILFEDSDITSATLDLIKVRNECKYAVWSKYRRVLVE